MKVFQMLVSLWLTSCADAELQSNKSLSKSPPEKKVITPTYEEIKKQIDSVRKSTSKQFLDADNLTQENITKSAGTYLRTVISDYLYPYWKGTAWDFNGTTTIPKKGSIACGYFVTGLLRDCGYKLNRIKLSTCASMDMMKELTSYKDIKNLSSLSYEEFENWIINNGEGLFIAGLDFHTGFIVNDGEQSWFIHSNYINKSGVVKEKLSESLALKSSKTRYITSLTRNKKFLRTWLLN